MNIENSAALARVFDVLEGRGFTKQATDREAIINSLSTGLTCYAGFDPTADSLHVGHLVPLLALIHLKLHGHHAIGLIGGATAMIGDPSGKSEMRRMLTEDDIRSNSIAMGRQLERVVRNATECYFLAEPGGSRGRFTISDNVEWIRNLNYIDFLRDIGRHFSVNRMLSFETYKMRMETGLSFIEFNYQLLQSYDYLELCRRHGCTLQIGGDDQWGNIVAGVDLVRRAEGREVHGLTFPLLGTSSGQKMGKTEKGALWIDPEKISPYEFYQYWVNTHDADLVKNLYLFTFLPTGEIEAVRSLQGSELNRAKDILAFEITSIVHGRERAVEAFSGAAAAFGSREIPKAMLPSSPIPRTAFTEAGNVPFSEISAPAVAAGFSLIDAIIDACHAKSRGEARRLVQGGGVYVNGERAREGDAVLAETDFPDGVLNLRIGKKKYHRFVLVRS